MATVPEIPSLRKPLALPVHHEEDDPMIALAEQIAEAQRELALRRQCYPGWITSGKLDAQDASHQLYCMEAIVRTLQRLDAEQRQLSLFATRE